MRNLLILSVFACALGADQLKPPTPGPREARQKPQDQSRAKKQAPQAEQRGTDTAPMVVKIAPTQVEQFVAAQKGDERHEKSAADRWMVLFTGALVASTIALVIVGAVQARRLRQSVEEMGKATRATERAADAAKQGADTAERALETTQRAFVFGKWDSALAKDGERLVYYVFGITWENVGLTPALEARSQIQWQEIPTGENKEPQFFPLEPGVAAVVGPRAKFTSDSVPIPLDSMIRNWRKESRIFVWARVEYIDVFSPTILHHHEACARVVPTQEPSASPPPDHVKYVKLGLYGPQNSAG